MKIIKKFHLNLATYFFFFLSFCCGYFKQAILIFFVVLLHECGHILAILFCKYKFLKVEFYPFGGITYIDKPINSSINKEILIAVSGVLFQSVFACVLWLLKTNGIYEQDYYFLQTYNLTILFFNLLPIIPLDGSIILHSLLEKVFSYKKALCVYEIISLFFFFLFLYYNIKLDIDNYFMCGVLLTQFFIEKKQKKYLIHRFFLERTLRNCPYKKIKNETNLDFNSLKKETLHFYYYENRYVHEKKVLENFYWKH